ncbi:DUF3617 domain-containing protein [Nitrosomonas sp. HPC101]|uniref:DUF3617 domain-containing protein n=1 Tax=Nitrosomonas sp. HPC101 TaxID=1658667 RepID=UPI001368AA44|nr:DUF3617 domain-containing protein [Nitrosomonas sp. HPC101]MXS85784.1 DUF3617 domain-containing protein [Nitrosomonas sp. HPC101]
MTDPALYKMTLKAILIALSLMVSTFGWAETGIRPGLWEVTTHSDLLGLVQHVPSEQMQQITLLARQYGVKIPHVKDGAATSRICITPEMAQQDIPSRFYENQSGCSVVDVSHSGNRYQVELACDNPRFKGNGHAEGVFSTPERFSGKTEFNSTVQDVPVYVSADTTGRWIGERCEMMQPQQ